MSNNPQMRLNSLNVSATTKDTAVTLRNDSDEGNSCLHKPQFWSSIWTQGRT